jgi:hypothetical protein
MRPDTTMKYIVDCETNERTVEIAAKWPSTRFALLARRYGPFDACQDAVQPRSRARP